MREEEFERDLKAVKELQKRTGITPEKLIETQELDIKFKGFAPKKQAVIVDAEDDGVLGGTYHYNASGRKVALMTPYGQPIKVWPGRVNRLHFLEYETSFVAGRQMTMQAWYRPRWRVV